MLRQLFNSFKQLFENIKEAKHVQLLYERNSFGTSVSRTNWVAWSSGVPCLSVICPQPCSHLRVFHRQNRATSEPESIESDSPVVYSASVRWTLIQKLDVRTSSWVVRSDRLGWIVNSIDITDAAIIVLDRSRAGFYSLVTGLEITRAFIMRTTASNPSTHVTDSPSYRLLMTDSPHR